MTIHNDLLLSEILWYRIGGAAKYVLECYNKEDVLRAVEFIQSNKINKHLVVGVGTNLLVSDKEFDGAVIRLCSNTQKDIRIVEDSVVEAYAGELLDDLIHFIFNNNMIGLEWSGGLPGTTGGAVRGNAGAFGGEIKDHVKSVEVFDMLTNQTKVLTNSDLQFSYRSSVVKQGKNLIVLSAQFMFKSQNPEQIEKAKETYHTNISYRQQNHPLEYPSVGSTFKNIIEKDKVEKVLAIYPDLKEKVETNWHGKVSTGHLLTRLGFAGYKIGNAMASDKHPNFIVNLGGATFSDIFQIINDIKKKFNDTLGFEPEEEVEIIS